MSGRYWLGVDLGGTKILAGLFDDSLNLLARNKQPTGAEGGPAGVIGRVAQAVEAVMREANVSPAEIGGMGFAIPGQIVPNEPVVRFAPNLDWRDVNVRQLLPAEWTWPVVLENDVRMGTYGEFAFGAAKGARHVFGVFVGTGVGGGFILNGELFTGHNGHAGEIGHVVVNWRKGTTLESVAGRKYQMKRAREILSDAPKLVRKEWKGVDLERVKSSQLASFYEKDDPVAVTIVDDAARAVAAGAGARGGVACGARPRRRGDERGARLLGRLCDPRAQGARPARGVSWPAGQVRRGGPRGVLHFGL
jgi:glucokinase